MDEEDFERVKSFRDEFKEKYLTNPTVEKKVDKIENGFFQEFMQTFDSNIDIDPGRLIGLTDGIFGMVMTLLVFSLALPGIELLNEMDFITFLQSNAPTFGLTIVSFILVSSFWIYHHEFLKIDSFNILHLWIHMFFLACISVIPFTTSMMGVYSEFLIAEALFGLNILLVILIFLIMYHHAYTKGFLVKKPSKSEKRYVINTFILIIILTLAVNILGYTISEDFMYLFLLVPVISTIRDIRFKMKSRSH